MRQASYLFYWPRRSQSTTASVVSAPHQPQAIDMNQDNYLAEALKMRNLVNEFNPPVYNDLTAAAGESAPALCLHKLPHVGCRASVCTRVWFSCHAAASRSVPPRLMPPALTAASVAAARRPANGRELPLVVETPGGGAPHVRVGTQYLERPW